MKEYNITIQLTDERVQAMKQWLIKFFDSYCLNLIYMEQMQEGYLLEHKEERIKFNTYPMIIEGLRNGARSNQDIIRMFLLYSYEAINKNN